MEEYSKTCPICGDKQIYSCKKSFLWSIKHNCKCKKCSSKENALSIDRSFQKEKKYRQKMSYSLKKARKKSKVYQTEEYKEKLRIAKINQIKKLGTQHTYNKNACLFIENFGKQNGFNFRHALNGGEVNISGYLLDGYDKEKNVVFEYDEPKHNAQSIKKKDKIREKRIIEKIKPVMFIRYDEQNKKLYDIISNKELM